MVRKLPPHIVLTNGQWRFVKENYKGKERIRHGNPTLKNYTSTSRHLKNPSKLRGVKRRNVIRVVHMAKRRTRRFGKRSGLALKPILAGSLISTGLGGGLIGIAGGYALGGKNGAIGAFAAPFILPVLMQVVGTVGGLAGGLGAGTTGTGTGLKVYG